MSNIGDISEGHYTLGAMDGIGITIALAATAVTAYAVWVAFLITRSDLYSRGQKVAQVALILLIPFAGAVFAHALLRSHTTHPEQPDRNFIPDRTQDPDNAFSGGKYVDDA